MIYLFWVKTYDYPGTLNMAVDVAIGELAHDVFLRFYTWQRPTLSLGKHQDGLDLDKDYIKMNGFDVVRRPSGGRAVLHWDELTYSVVIPNTHDLFNTKVLELYNLLSGIIVDGLNDIGYPVKIVEGHRKPVSSVCFQVPSIYEVALDDVKVIGSAQTRTQKYILQHGSIVLIPHEEIKQCFTNTKHLDIPLIGLYSYFERSIDEIADAIKNSFERYFGRSMELKNSQFDEILNRANEMEGMFVWKK
ncbi:MAG: biotin/lipoate A/B protein ligase family protein [Fervidobacterium sp.]